MNYSSISSISTKSVWNHLVSTSNQFYNEENVSDPCCRGDSRPRCHRMRSGALGADFITPDGAEAADRTWCICCCRHIRVTSDRQQTFTLWRDFRLFVQKNIRMNPLTRQRPSQPEIFERGASFQMTDAPRDTVWTKTDVTAAQLISCTAAECEALWLDDSDGSEMIYSSFVCFLFYRLKCINPAPLTCHLWVCSSALGVGLDPDSGSGFWSV